MTTQQFLQRLEELYKSNLEISRAKNKDYAGDGDPFKNFKLCETLGICSVEKGMLVRITDKLSRISNLLEKEAEVKDESVLDTLQDLSNYAMIMRVYLESKKKQKEETLEEIMKDLPDIMRGKDFPKEHGILSIGKLISKKK